MFLIKWIAVSALLTVFFALQSLNLCLSRGLLREKRKLWINHKLSKLCIKIVGARLVVHGEIPGNLPLILIGNHLSWLDTILLTSLVPSSFVTSTDVKGHSFTGSITRMAGCRFVKRSPIALRREMEALHSYFDQGLNLTFYPEATTGDGTKLLPFKPALFDLSLKTNTPVLLIYTQYMALNNEVLSVHNKENIYYYGEVGFMEHLNRVLRLKSLDVEITIGPMVHPEFFNDRKDMAQQLHKQFENVIETGFFSKESQVHEEVVCG